MTINKRLFPSLDFAITACMSFLIICLPFLKAGVEIFAWLSIFLWLLKFAFGYRPKLTRLDTTLNKAILVFLAVNAISVIFSVNEQLSLRGFFGKELKFVAIFFMLTEVINNKLRLRFLLAAIIASIVLTVCDAGFQYFRGVDFLRNYEWARLTASFSNSNSLATWLNIMIFFLFGLLVSYGKKYLSLKIFCIILIPAMFICLLATYTRAGWISFVAGFCFILAYLMASIGLKPRRNYFLTLLAIVMIFLFLPLQLKQKLNLLGNISFRDCTTINNRLTEKTNLGTDADSIFVRLNLWQEASDIIKDRPIIGFGLNTYSSVAPKYRKYEWGGIYPHNSFLQMTAETGILGFFSFAWFMFNFFKVTIGHIKNHKNTMVLGLLAGIISFLFHSIFDNHLYALQLVVLFWFMLGLTIAVIKLERKLV